MMMQVRRLVRRRPATACDGQISPEKRKVGSSTLPLTTQTLRSWQPSGLYGLQVERDLQMAVQADPYLSAYLRKPRIPDTARSSVEAITGACQPTR